MITLPLSVFLLFKIEKGVRWIRSGFTRPAYSSYYMYSWAFYTAFFVQMSFISAFAWKIFNDSFRAIITFQLAICIPFWVLMFFHMRYEDKKSRELNTLRKELREEKLRKLTQQKRDERFLSQYSRFSQG